MINLTIFLCFIDSLLSLAAAAAKSLQSCPTLCDPIDGSPRGSPVPGILQARTLTGVGCHFLLQCMKVKHSIPYSSSISLPRQSFNLSDYGFSRCKLSFCVLLFFTFIRDLLVCCIAKSFSAFSPLSSWGLQISCI